MPSIIYADSIIRDVNIFVTDLLAVDLFDDHKTFTKVIDFPIVRHRNTEKC